MQTRLSEPRGKHNFRKAELVKENCFNCCYLEWKYDGATWCNQMLITADGSDCKMGERVEGIDDPQVLGWLSACPRGVVCDKFVMGKPMFHGGER